mgnify:CR=1 FL=1
MKIIVVGGGAAGMMAAYHAANIGNQVLLLEKNEKLGKKIYITGKGRCNVTNAADMETLFGNINRNAKFCYSALYGFDNNAVYSFMEENGCSLKIERGDRVFPVSDHASDVIKALSNALKKEKVEVMLNTTVKSLIIEENTVKGVLLSNQKKLLADKVILATGGKAGIQYGCTGDGFKLASSLGHNVIKPIPALTQLLANDDLSDLGGVRAKARISFISSREGAETILAEDSGEVQFNKDSLSGICTFNVSRFYQIKDGVKYIAELDLMEEYSEEEFAALLKFRQQNLVGAYAFDLLSCLIPEKLVFYILKKAEVDPMCIITEVKGRSLQRIIEITKSLRFAIVGTKSWKDAQVTAGGVDVSEVNAETLESTKSKCLFFAGEILDVDGPCGGYNLTWAFASGMIAGSAAAKKCKKID